MKTFLKILAKFIYENFIPFVIGYSICFAVNSCTIKDNESLEVISQDDISKNALESTENLSKDTGSINHTKKTTSRNLKPSGELTEVIVEESIDSKHESLLFQNEINKYEELLSKYEYLKYESANKRELRIFGGIGISRSFKLKGLAGFNTNYHGSLVTTDGNKDHALFYTFGHTFK